MPQIQSERLDRIPLTLPILRALLARDLVAAGTLLGLPFPDYWLDCHWLLSLRAQQLENDPTLQPWLLRAIVLRGQGAMVGHIGFHDRPGADYLATIAPAAVEFGFTVFPEFRRRGYALEASLALMQWARRVHRVRRFVLSISPENSPSLALAARLGFRRIGSHVDEMDGPEDIFERRFELDDGSEFPLHGL